jgi:hypothetical protein
MDLSIHSPYTSLTCESWLSATRKVAVFRDVIPWESSKGRFPFNNSTLNWRKITNKCTRIVHIFLKFIYLCIASTCFGYSIAIMRVIVVRYSEITICIFSKIQLFILVFFSFSLSGVKIINKILKMFCCLTLLCVVVCVSRDGWLINLKKKYIYIYTILVHSLGVFLQLIVL